MNLSALDLNLLLVFEAVLDGRSVSAAARRLGIGQPGTSAALGRLRMAVGDELFVRAGGEMRPTAKALELAPGIAAALASLRQTFEAGVDFDPGRATRSFALGSTDYTTLVLLPPLAAHLRRCAPGVDLHVVGYEKGTVPEMLDRGEVDVAVGVFPQPPERAIVTPLFEERFVGVARPGHPAVLGGRMDAETFAALPHALITTRRDATGAVDEALARRGLKRRIALTLPYAMALPAALGGTDLVASVPSRLARRVAEEGQVQCFELPVTTGSWTVSMLWPASARNNRALAWLRGTIARLSALA